MLNLYITVLMATGFAFFNRKITYFFGVMIVMVMGYVRDYGPDYSDYVNLLSGVEAVIGNIVGGGVEPIWLVFVFLFDLLQLDVNARLAILAVVSFSIHFFAISKFFSDKKLFILGLIVYLANDFIIRDLGQIRNGMASSFFLLGFVYHYLESNKKAFLCYITAALFHISFLFPVVFLVLYFRYGFKFMLLIAPVLLLSANVLVANVARIAEIIPLRVLDRVSNYSTSETYLTGFNGTPVFFITSIALFILGWLNLHYFTSRQKSLIMMYYVAILVFLLFYEYVVIASRLATTFTTLNCLFIPLLMVNNRKAKSFIRLSVVAHLFFAMVGLFYMYSFIDLYNS